MNRFELQQLAEERVLDAQALLAAHRWSGAYYLAGYAVECGLKSCVLAFVERTGVIFQDRKYIEKCWTHDLEVLVGAAGLTAARGIDVATNPALKKNWLVVKDWNELSRYERKPHFQAKKMVNAVADRTNGVLQWIRAHW